MIIKRCNVINYGTLNNFKYEFNQGLNIINKDNGFGKTTLASFIKSMFYGLENSSRVKLDERKKYTPWNGGKFGGSLDFEVDDKEYRVERFFGKTVKSDKCVVIDLQTNLQSKKYNENLGYQLFGVDRESFEKSTFFPQLDLKLNGINDDIHEKLSEIVESSKDSNSYSQAKEKLEKKSTELYYNKSTGKIALNDKEISVLKNKLDGLYKLDEDLHESLLILETLKGKREELENKVLELKKTISDNYENVKKVTLQKSYNDIVLKINNKKKIVNDLEQLGIPSEDEIRILEEKCNYLSFEKNNINTMSLQKKSSDEYTRHHADKFDQKDVDEALKILKQKEINGIKIKELEDSNNQIYNEKYDDLTDEMFNEVNSLIIKSGKKNNVLDIILPIICVCTMVCSFVFKENKALVFAFAITCLLACFITAIYLINKTKKNKYKTKDDIIIKGFIKKYVVDPDYNKGYQKLVSDIYVDYKKNLEVKEKQIFNSNKISELEEKNKIIEEKFDVFKRKYNYIDLDINSAVDKVRLDYVLYLDVEKNNEIIDEKIKLSNEKYNSEMNLYQESISKYNIRFDSFKEIDTLKERLINYNNYLKDVNDLELEKNNFINNNVVSQGYRIDVLEETVKCFDVQELNQLLSNHEKDFENIKLEVLNVEKKIERLSEQTSEIISLEEELELLLEENYTLKQEKVLLDKTVKLLEEAKNNLSSNYLIPMKESFVSNINKITNNGEFNIDIDLNISVRSEGESFASEYLSKGYQDLVNICVRLALVENVFKKQNPVLILDDPFVNLDENKLNKAKELLNLISEKYQVIYLICHDSRNIYR